MTYIPMDLDEETKRQLELQAQLEAQQQAAVQDMANQGESSYRDQALADAIYQDQQDNKDKYYADLAAQDALLSDSQERVDPSGIAIPALEDRSNMTDLGIRIDPSGIGSPFDYTNDPLPKVNSQYIKEDGMVRDKNFPAWWNSQTTSITPEEISTVTQSSDPLDAAKTNVKSAILDRLNNVTSVSSYKTNPFDLGVSDKFLEKLKSPLARNQSYIQNSNGSSAINPQEFSSFESPASNALAKNVGDVKDVTLGQISKDRINELQKRMDDIINSNPVPEFETNKDKRSREWRAMHQASSDLGLNYEEQIAAANLLAKRQDDNESVATRIVRSGLDRFKKSELGSLPEYSPETMSISVNGKSYPVPSLTSVDPNDAQGLLTTLSNVRSSLERQVPYTNAKEVLDDILSKQGAAAKGLEREQLNKLINIVDSQQRSYNDSRTSSSGSEYGSTRSSESRDSIGKDSNTGAASSSRFSDGRGGSFGNEYSSGERTSKNSSNSIAQSDSSKGSNSNSMTSGTGSQYGKTLSINDNEMARWIAMNQAYAGLARTTIETMNALNEQRAKQIDAALAPFNSYANVGLSASQNNRQIPTSRQVAAIKRYEDITQSKAPEAARLFASTDGPSVERLLRDQNVQRAMNEVLPNWMSQQSNPDNAQKIAGVSSPLVESAILMGNNFLANRRNSGEINPENRGVLNTSADRDQVIGDSQTLRNIFGMAKNTPEGANFYSKIQNGKLTKEELAQVGFALTMGKAASDAIEKFVTVTSTDDPNKPIVAKADPVTALKNIYSDVTKNPNDITNRIRALGMLHAWNHTYKDASGKAPLSNFSWFGVPTESMARVISGDMPVPNDLGNDLFYKLMRSRK